MRIILHYGVSYFLRLAICVLTFISTMSMASAQSLRDLRAQDAENQKLAREAAYTGEVCGLAVEASIDWSSAANWPPDQSLADACNGALSAVETICRKGRAGAVSSFVCAGDGSGPSLSGARLRYGAKPGVNGYDATLSVLGGE